LAAYKAVVLKKPKFAVVYLWGRLVFCKAGKDRFCMVLSLLLLCLAIINQVNHDLVFGIYGRNINAKSVQKTGAVRYVSFGFQDKPFNNQEDDNIRRK